MGTFLSEALEKFKFVKQWKFSSEDGRRDRETPF